MSQTMTGEQAVLADLNARLPKGYRARSFEDADREPLVEAGNAESHEMERQSAAEWRRWESMFTDKTQLRLVLTAPDGSVAGMGSIQAGFFPRPDAQQIGIGVRRDHRNRGI